MEASRRRLQKAKLAQPKDTAPQVGGRGGILGTWQTGRVDEADC